MNKWCSALALASLLLGSGQLGADEKKKALETTSPDAARDQALAWLKDAGKADADTIKRFEGVWKQSGRTVPELLVDTFVLVDAKASEIMKQARDPMAAAPVAVPDILKDAKLPVFFRANLAVGYAQALNGRRVHEEALQTLALFRPEQVADPAAYLFQRGVAEHALLLKTPAEETFKRLRDDVAGAPDADLKAAAAKVTEMKAWKEKDLAAVARKMLAVERRLGLGRGGAETQKAQKNVLQHLGELYKEVKAREDLKEKKVVDPKQPKLLSLSDELQMLHALQEKLNKSTELLGRQYQEKEGEQTSDPKIRQELKELQKRQEKLGQLVSRMGREQS